MKTLKPYTRRVRCSVCKTKGFIRNYDGVKVKCFYCQGTKFRNIPAPHPSHEMTEFRTEILAPCGTPRFYKVRHCKKCGQTEAQHAAGHFLERLQFACEAASSPNPNKN